MNNEEENSMSQETPTGDAAENFLKANRVNKGEDIPRNENGSRLAEQLALDEKSIISQGSDLTEGIHVLHYGELKDGLIISNHGDSGIEMILFTSKISGLGDVIDGIHAVNLDFNEKSQQENSDTFGIHSPHHLSISVFTDLDTFPKIQEMRQKREISSEFMYTSYYFDENGNYAKTIQLPRDFPDDRPVISEGKHYKSLKVDMTSGDFELAGTALSLIKEKLQEVQINPDQGRAY